MGSFEIIETKNDAPTATLNAHNASLSIGVQGLDGGNIKLIDLAGREVFKFEAHDARLKIGSEGNWGTVQVKDSYGRGALYLDGGNAGLYVGIEGVAGSEGTAGNFKVRDVQGRDVFYVDGPNAIVNVGASINNAGDFRVRDVQGRIVFKVDGKNAAMYVGAKDNEGDIRVRDNGGNDSIILDGNGAWMGVHDHDANRAFAAYTEGMNWNGNSVAFLAVGKHKEDEPKEGRKAGVVVVRNPEGDDSILLDGTKGDIILANADCAEEFDVSTLSVTEPGTVMVFTKDGSVIESNTAYDKKVAGVVSGAGNYRAGIVLDRRMSRNKRVPLALMGKVYCKVDAEFSEIEVGDLLTTSPRPGHAMKAVDPLKAFGTIIGKSLGSLSEGRRLLPILVSLQ